MGACAIGGAVGEGIKYRFGTGRRDLEDRSAHTTVTCRPVIISIAALDQSIGSQTIPFARASCIERMEHRLGAVGGDSEHGAIFVGASGEGRSVEITVADLDQPVRIRAIRAALYSTGFRIFSATE